MCLYGLCIFPSRISAYISKCLVFRLCAILSKYAFWKYFVGKTCYYCSIFLHAFKYLKNLLQYFELHFCMQLGYPKGVKLIFLKKMKTNKTRKKTRRRRRKRERKRRKHLKFQAKTTPRNPKLLRM